MGLQPFRVHFEEPEAVQLIAGYLGGLMYPHRDRQPVVLCIGSDRVTGDSLGPLVGTWLQEEKVPLPIYGSLASPVHAGNLERVVDEIRRCIRNSVILAVDACLGRAENVGKIALSSGPLAPGKGVGKDLGRVGDVGITGVVNVGGFMEPFVLQNTPLGLVWPMSRVIAQGIAQWASTLPATAQVAAGEV